MTTTQHTPGPWIEYSQRGETIRIQSYGKFEVIASIQPTKDIPIIESDANARLIAAAPDLLAALKSVMELVDSQDIYLRRSLNEEIEAAIAKAEGKA